MTDPSTRKDYEALRLARWAVSDALSAAGHIASRCADCFEGTEMCIAFSRLRDAIFDFRECSPEMKAISDAMFAARSALHND